MRLVTLIILILIAAGGVCVYLNVGGIRDTLFKAGKQVVEDVQGYPAAETPAKAQELFTKAIKDRDFKIAAKYVKGNYAEYLVKAHETAQPIAQHVDWLSNFGKNEKVESPKSVFLLYAIDPFPTNFETAGEPKKDGEDKATAHWSATPLGELNEASKWDMGRMDPNILGKHCLSLPAMYKGLTVVKEKDGDKTAWKLEIDISKDQMKFIDYFIDNGKRFENALHTVKSEAKSRERTLANRDQFAQIIANALTVGSK